MSRVLPLLVLAVMLSGCLVTGGNVDVLSVWDLRDSPSTEAVGWPEDAGSAFEARSSQGLDRILLPGDHVVEGEFRANVSRDGGLYGRPYEDRLRSLTVTFEREAVDEVMERADAYAEELGMGLGRLSSWARANRGGQDTSPGGAMALSDRTTLGPGGPSVQMETRAFPSGDALLRLLVVWPRDE